MISIIICSRETDISTSLKNNIQNTIGCKYELIVIDNSQNTHSIFKAYNLGIEQSNGDYWCFLHDDILFHNQDWGKHIEDIFKKDSKMGLVGLAGSKIKSKMPSAWWTCPEEFRVINIIQHLRSGKIQNWQIGWEENKIEEVIAIDGVFMAARRLDNFRFSNILAGFHNYDLNLSFEYIKHNYKISITKEIILEHFSQGSIDSSWYHSTIKVHDLYKNILPLKINNQIAINYRKLEFDNGSKFLLSSVKYISKWIFIKFWIRLLLLKPISKRHFNFFKLLFK